jgi:hypothetical protein
MSDWKRWLDRRIGRRNLPFIGAAVLLAVVIVLLMHYSPSTDSGSLGRSPTVVSSD